MSSIPSLQAIVIGLGLCIASTACSGGDSQDQGQEESQQQTAIKQPPKTDGFKEGDSEPHGQLDAVTNYEIGLRHLREGHPEAAVEHLDLALALEKSNPRIYDARSSALFALGKLTEALASSEAAVKLLPADAGLRVNRGLLYVEFGRKKEAFADYDEALRLSPGFAPAHYNRGVLFYMQAENEKALAEFSAAINSQPELANPYFNRAMAHETLGNLDAAKVDMTAFLERTNNQAHQDLAHTLLKRWTDGAEEVELDPSELPESPHIAPPVAETEEE
ncbi:MAG: tetratricopeptide repeat protein [Planctomycetes bacterium]|nr:tetratricopeptide repeat protein [Planctomycetota bacterium]MCP4859960.1 tetratricopeptide repeat protein [Planctomycetota bacterium]